MLFRIVSELLAQGFNVILHGRNEDKLKKVISELQIVYPNQSMSTFVWDATQTLEPGGKNLANAVIEAIGSRRLTVLVNNVGYTSTYHTFASQSPLEIDMVINLQVSFLAHLTRALIPTLASNQPALIINVGGLTRLFPAPFLAVHSGGKAFLMGFSRALAIEFELVRDPPIDIECITVDVHNVATNSNGSTPSFLTPDAKTMGKAIIGVVGCGKRFVTAYWKAELTEHVLRCMPHSWMDSILAKEMIEMRARELARARGDSK